MSNSRGILLICVGHPYYGKMAAALAATIRMVDNSISIHLAYSESSVKYLSRDELALFSSMDIIPNEYYVTKKGIQFIRTKMFMYELSPFDKTLFLDCDLLWLSKQPQELFLELDGSPISYENYGFADLSTGNVQYSSKIIYDDMNLWAKIEDIRKAYSFDQGRYYHLQSEVFYFERGMSAKKYFKLALKIYDNIKVDYRKFAGGVPDELPFAIAAAQLDMFPHKDSFIPCGFKFEKKYSILNQYRERYFLISMFGNNSMSYLTERYNILTMAAYHKLGLQHPYKWKNKRSFLKERKVI